MRADAGGRVRQVLDAALRAPAGAPPDASGLARALFDAGAALPIRGGDGSRSEPDLARRWSAPAGGRHRASRPPTGGRRVAAVLVLAAVGVVAAAAVGVGWAEVDPGPEPAIVGSDSSHRTWSDVLADLDALRSRAFATADASALAAVYTDRSPALDRDRAALARLARAGLRTEGLRLDAVEVVETSRQADRVLLRVADVLGGYRLVDPSGAVVDTHPGRGRTWWTVTLVRAGGRWKVYDVARG
jgi:hypothetical protein